MHFDRVYKILDRNKLVRRSHLVRSWTINRTWNPLETEVTAIRCSNTATRKDAPASNCFRIFQGQPNNFLVKRRVIGFLTVKDFALNALIPRPDGFNFR